LTVTIKFVYHSETRRATYNLPISLQQIQSDIANTLIPSSSSSPSHFTLNCYHGYREVPVNADSEFQPIVKHHSEKTLPLRIRISQEKDETDKISNSNNCSQADRRNTSTQFQRKEVERCQHSVICSLCFSKIQGIRWKCSRCLNCDLCNNCEASHSRSHPLIRIVEELPSSSEIVFSLCTGLHQVSDSAALTTAKTAKEEIREFLSDIFDNTSQLSQEIEGLVQASSKIVQNIPQKLQDLQTMFSQVLSCTSSEKSCRTEEEEEGEEEVLSQFSEQHQILLNMGFSQRERNQLLLSNYNGNIELCVDQLLQD